MIGLEETLDILENMEALTWKDTICNDEEKDIKDPLYGKPFPKKILLPACLIVLYIACRQFNGGFFESLFLVIIVGIIWKVTRKFLHLRKAEVKEKLESIDQRRYKHSREYNRLKNRLADSVVPAEYRYKSAVKQLISYIDSGAAQDLKEAIDLLYYKQMKDRMEAQDEEIETLKQEVKDAKNAAARAKNAAAKAESKARSASSTAGLSYWSKK